MSVIMAGKLMNRLLSQIVSIGSKQSLSTYFSLSFEDCTDSVSMNTINTLNETSASKRNVEIKAFLGSNQDYQAAVKIAQDLTSNAGEVIKQRDVFFKTLEGRLKLRYIENGIHQLIYYSRDDKSGPKLSTYRCVEIGDPEGLEFVLSISNGTTGIVEKERLLFIYKNTRIHLDKVKELGNYLEFEVMLKPEDTVEQGQEFAEHLMNIFKIKNENLITGAYTDLLTANGKNKINFFHLA